MLAFDPFTLTLMISLMPVFVLLLYFFVKNHQEGRRGRRTLAIIMGFAAITAYYIVTPDPMLAYIDFTSKGHWLELGVITLISVALLFIAVVYFKRGVEDE